MLTVRYSPAAYRPCLVLALNDAEQISHTKGCFQRLGWDVYTATGGADARRLMRMLSPELVVLDATLTDESGFLTCAKMKSERPGCQVVVVSDEVTSWEQERARFAGATALARREENLTSLVPTTRWHRPVVAA